MVYLFNNQEILLFYFPNFRGQRSGGGILVFHTWSRVVSAMERVRSKNLYTHSFTRNELQNFRLMFRKTLALIYGVLLYLKPVKVPIELPMFIITTLFAPRPFYGKSFIWICLDILKQILWGILFGSASRAIWDKLTVSEMVQDIESVSLRDWFICHIFWVYRLEITTL